jgi:hypothetical protein
MGSDEWRIPVGASNNDAAVAERLQFTAAEGPCLDAQALDRPVLATETVLTQRWPQFAAALIGEARRHITAHRVEHGVPGREQIHGDPVSVIRGRGNGATESICEERPNGQSCTESARAFRFIDRT